MIKSKRGVTVLLWNVIIGMILIFLGFLVFISIQGKLHSLKNPQVSDAQFVDVTSSYAGVMTKIDADGLEKWHMEMKKKSVTDEFYIFNLNSIKKYTTFEESLGRTEDLDLLVGKYGTYDEITFYHLSLSYFYKDKWRGFEMMSLSSKGMTIDCDDEYFSGYCNFWRDLS